MNDSKKAAQAKRLAPLGITKENLLFTLPVALRGDQSTEALAEATAELLADRLEEIDRLRIISNIDNLEEGLLAILARDFKVDWWDPNYSLQEKRQTVKDSWRVHKLLGTKAAVETAIRAIYPETTVEPWFEYRGEPYHFRLRINITGDSGDRARQKRVLERLDYYKSLRDTLDTVKYFLLPEKATTRAGGAFLGIRHARTIPIQPPSLSPPGGRGQAHAWGALGGTYRRIVATAKPAGVQRPVGRGGTGCAAGVVSTYQRFTVKIN